MKKHIACILALVTTTILYAQENWELQKEEDGIKVYTCYMEGSDIRSFKAETVMEGKLSSFVAVLKDVDTFPELFSANMYAEVMEQSDTFQLQYSQTHVPWPLTNRDGVYKNIFSQHYGTKAVTVSIESVDGLKTINEDFVRIEKAMGYWLMYPVDFNRIEITYQMHAEPGGKLPPWVINMFLVDSPIKDLKNIRERVKMDKYQNKKYEFLVEY